MSRGRSRRRCWRSSNGSGSRSCRPARPRPRPTSSPWASRSPCTRRAPTSTGRGRSTSSPGSSRPPSGRAVERGLVQRLMALNRFIDDVYNDRRIVADGVFPAELLDDSVELPAGVPGRAPEVRGVGAHLGLRPRARRRRHDLRARGQPARAVRRQLRDREPRRRQAGVPRAVRPPEHRPRRRLHRRAQQAARLAGAGRRDRPVDRRAHAGHLQLGVLRALVPRPADGRHARRGRRPHGAATTTACTCARSTASSRSTSSTAASTTSSSTPRRSSPTRCSACPG